jgi:truncated hemoglobin YjbI
LPGWVASPRCGIKHFEYQHASAFLGGPDTYTGRPLSQAHAPHPIMGGHFARRLQLLRQVFEAHHVPDDVREAWLAHNAALRDQVTQQDLGECRD